MIIYLFFVLAFLIQCLPATWTHEIWFGPVHFFNLFYLLITLGLLTKIKNLRIIPVLLFSYGLVLGVMSYFTYQHFVIKFFFKDIIVFLGIICGLLLTSVPPKIVIKTLKHCFYISLILLTITMYTNALGLTGNNHKLRLFDDSNFFPAYFVVFFRPFALYFTSQKEVISYYVVKYSWLVSLYFAVISATRSVLIIVLLSLVLEFLVNSRLSFKQMSYIGILGLLVILIFSSNLSSNFFILERLGDINIEEEARLIELFFMFDGMGNNFWGLGYGAGFKSYLNVINEEKFGDRPLAYPHMGFFAFYLKGGIVYMLMALYMLFYAIYSILFKKSKFIKIFAYMMLIHFALSLLSGGYSFLQFLFLFFAYYTLSSKNSYYRYHYNNPLFKPELLQPKLKSS